MDNLNTGHERVEVHRDDRTGLVAVIALHSTKLGPAAGGCRRWKYADVQEARQDALRLSESMTYKNALAGIPFGGGKAVIMADSNPKPSKVQLHQFATWLNELEGDYITAEDVGMGVEQMRTMAAISPHVFGLGRDGAGGDPSPHTAYGVYLGLKAAVQHKLGTDDMRGVHIAVQGLGAVGMSLCELLAASGADLRVTDIDSAKVAYAQQRFDACGVNPDVLLAEPADVFAPCALGGVITQDVARSLNVSVVAGAANNQLVDPTAGEILARRGIVYAPDFVINAAGVISVAYEVLCQRNDFGQTPEHTRECWVGTRIHAISTRLLDILAVADAKACSTEQVARQMALKIVGSGSADAAIAA